MRMREGTWSLPVVTGESRLGYEKVQCPLLLLRGRIGASAHRRIAKRERTQMKKSLGLATAVLLAASMTACSSGSNSGGDYCSTLKTSQSEFTSMDFTSLNESQFSALRDKISTLQDQAPSDVSDDWGVIGDKLDAFKSALDEAGVSFDDIKTLQQNKLPQGVDPAKLQAMGTKIQQLVSDPKLSTAQTVIKDNAKKDCHITLGTSTP